MTKDEAAPIISRAILAEGNQQHILGADAFAQGSQPLSMRWACSSSQLTRNGVGPSRGIRSDQLAQDPAAGRPISSCWRYAGGSAAAQLGWSWRTTILGLSSSIPQT